MILQCHALLYCFGDFLYQSIQIQLIYIKIIYKKKRLKIQINEQYGMMMRI